MAQTDIPMGVLTNGKTKFMNTSGDTTPTHDARHSYFPFGKAFGSTRVISSPIS